jgi:competence protein ComEC
VTASPSDRRPAGGPWTVADRDPWSPDAIRRRRGAPDLRLVPAALVTWVAVTVTVLTRSPVPALVAAGTAVVPVVLLRCLGPDRSRHGRSARWSDRFPLRSLLRTTAVAPVLAAAWALRAWQRTRVVDRHPWPAARSTVADGDYAVTGAPRPVRDGGVVLDVDVPDLGHVPVFVGGGHGDSGDSGDSAGQGRVTDLLDIRPGTVLHITGSVRTDDRPGLVPVTVSARGIPEPLRDPTGLQAVTGHLRAALRESASHLPGTTGDLVPGMVVGDTGRLSAGTRTDFLATGLSHLMAVSGANVATVTGAVLLAAVALRVGKRGQVVAAAVALVLFALLVGPEPSVLRATVMGAVGLVAVASARRTHGFAACSAAVLLLLLVDPGLAVEYAFILSVVATVGIVALAPWISRRLLQVWARSRGRRGRGAPVQWQLMLTRLVGVSLAADVVTAPVIVHMVGVVSPTALPANLLVGPAVAPLTVVGMAGALVAGVWVPAGTAVLWGTVVPAWWILTVAGRLGQVPVLHTAGGWWPALALVPVVASVVVLVAVPRLQRRAATVLAVSAVLAAGLVRAGAVTVGPYDDEGDGQQLTRVWAEDLARVGPWQIGVRWRDGRPELLTPDGGEPPADDRDLGDTVAVLPDDTAVLRAENRDRGRGVPSPQLYVVTACGRSRGMPSMTPGGVPVAYPCRDGTVVLTGDGLHADGRPA